MKSSKKTLSIVLATILVFSALAVFAIGTASVRAATEEEIEQAIEDGITWLVAQQNPVDGSWPAYWENVATTGLAVLKLEMRAYELGYDSPFDPNYEYHGNVTAGLNYLFGQSRLLNVTITPQNHTAGATGTIDDPDYNNNTLGVYAHGHTYPFDTYDTGIVLSAISASGTPNRVVNVSGSVVDGWKYVDVAQDMVDWLAWGQADLGAGEGGWEYKATDDGAGKWPEDPNANSPYGPDNSNSGYAVLGLAYAQEFGCTVLQWVKTELDAYIGNIQDPVDGDANDGGSWYTAYSTAIGVNILKTGNLIFEMALVGDTPDTPRVVDALDYLARHWNASSGTNWPPGWDGDPAQYQTMFCTMKGLEYMGIDTFNGIDWYADFSDKIVAQQCNISGPNYGSWQQSSGRGNPTIITEWALLTLEKVAPPPPEITVYVDIKPGSWPNPFNQKSRGVLPVAICGTEDFDVTTIDPATIKLTREGIEEGVSPIRWSYEDVATPYTGEPGGGHDLNGDGYLDLTLKFSIHEVETTLGLDAFKGQTIPLIITGNLYEEHGGTPIRGEDYVWILMPRRSIEHALLKIKQAEHYLSGV